MAQTFNIPISFRFMKIPVVWEIRTVKGSHHRQEDLAFPILLTDKAKLSELDGWACRDELLTIPESDNEALLEFLAKVGVFHREEGELIGHWSDEVMEHYRKGHPVPVSVRGLWEFRDGLRRALVNREAFKEDYAPTQPRPYTEIQLAKQSGIEFPLRFEITKIASGVVTITDAYHMLLATVFADVTRGVRFKTCKRKDCQKPFPIESKHAKKFCSQYCGHLVSQRKNREAEKRKRRARKST